MVVIRPSRELLTENAGSVTAMKENVVLRLDDFRCKAAKGWAGRIATRHDGW